MEGEKSGEKQPDYDYVGTLLNSRKVWLITSLSTKDDKGQVEPYKLAVSFL